MDERNNGRRRTIDGRELIFLRCDREGNELSEARLRGLGVTNPTIERIVGDVAGRLEACPEGYFETGMITG